MATTLDKPLIRETGLVRNGKQFLVMLVPSEMGGTVIFKEKGKHGKGIEVALMKMLETASGVTERTVEPLKVFVPAPAGVDLVDLGTLETRLMVDGEKVMTPDVKGRLFKIIREIREERREDAGSAPLHLGTTKKGKS